MTYLLASIAGGLGGMLISWLMGLYGSRRGGNLSRQRLIFNEGRTARNANRSVPTTPKPTIVPTPQSSRIYRGAMWREKGSGIWYPLGEEPDWDKIARDQIRQRNPNPPPREP